MRAFITCGAILLAIVTGTPRGATFNHIQANSIQIGDSCVGKCILAIGDSGVICCINPKDSDWARGATGPSGLNGSNGNTGSTGSVGGIGPMGNNGNTGATGSTGSVGSSGATGLQGPTGATGTQGNQGVQGPTGINGATGTNGTAGQVGATGIQGATGSNGSTGAQGIAGPTGAQGITGVAGPTGGVGATGATGLGTVYYSRTQGAAPTTYTAINYTSLRTTNSSGVIIDTLTTNGSFTGTAIFSHINGIQISGKYSGSFVSIPLSAYTVAANLKSITINVGSGTILGILGATILSVGAGQEVSIHLIGD